MTDLLQALHETSLGTAVRETAPIFPWIECLHVLTATTVFGTIAIVDLRLLGYGAHRRGARQLIGEILPFTWIAFVIAIVTGGMLFVSNALTYWSNGPFRAKMVMLVFAGVNVVIFHVTTHRRIVEWDEAPLPPTAAKLSGAASLSLWLAVIFLGRWVGFTLT